MSLCYSKMLFKLSLIKVIHYLAKGFTSKVDYLKIGCFCIFLVLNAMISDSNYTYGYINEWWENEWEK